MTRMFRSVARGFSLVRTTEGSHYKKRVYLATTKAGEVSLNDSAIDVDLMDRGL